VVGHHRSFPVLADGRNHRYPSAPHSGANVLHLVYEFAKHNPSLNRMRTDGPAPTVRVG
jgi:hypothetical protein